MVNQSKTTPVKYQLIANEIRDLIHLGQLKPGDKLPTFADLRKRYEITSSTAERSYMVLEQEGLIERRHGSGTYVLESRRQRTGKIGLIVSESFERQSSAFYTLNAMGLMSAAEKYNRQLLLLATDYDWNKLSFDLVDGLILSGHRPEINAAIAAAKPAHMPCVSMLVRAPEMASVIVDDYQAASLAVKYLYQHGHRRIGCLIGDDGSHVLRQRIEGFRDTVNALGIGNGSANRHRVIPYDTDDVRKQKFVHWGHHLMSRWLQEDWSETACTALVVQNDNMAIGVMRALMEANYQIPQQVSVIGFDGTELCDHVYPRLTSVQLPLEKIGSKAVEMLVQQIESNTPNEEVILLPTVIHQGESVATI